MNRPIQRRNVKRALVVAAIFAFGVLGCPSIEPGPEGDRARAEIGGAIRAVLPAPWGEIGALITTGALGGVAALRDRAARKARQVADTSTRAAEAAAFGIEEVYQRVKRQAESGDVVSQQAVATLKAVKQAARKASTMLNVPAEFEAVVEEVNRKNGFVKDGPAPAT